MCGHRWIVVNDLSICTKCGLTIDRISGKPLGFDKRLINRRQKKNAK